MDPLSEVDRALLISAIAFKERTVAELCEEYAATRDELINFARSNREKIDKLRAQPKREITTRSNEPSPTQLKDLWITNKFERIRRLQAIAEQLYDDITGGNGGDATTLREFRSYTLLVANELGQLLNRGAGDSSEADVLRVDISGIDMEALR